MAFGHFECMDWTLYIIGFISSSSHIYSLVLLHIIYYMLHIYNKLYAPLWLFLLGVGGTVNSGVQASRLSVPHPREDLRSSVMVT